MREVYCPINLSQQMVFRYQHVRAQQFDRLALFGLSVHHFHHLGLLYQKKPLMATFFDRLRSLPFGKATFCMCNILDTIMCNVR